MAWFVGTILDPLLSTMDGRVQVAIAWEADVSLDSSIIEGSLSIDQRSVSARPASPPHRWQWNGKVLGLDNQSCFTF